MLRSLCVVGLLTASASAYAQTPGFPPPGPGRSVDFVACPERTAGGSWVATDRVTGYTYSMLGAQQPLPNVVIRVSGIVSPEAPPAPGWLLAPITVVVGRQPCLSAGILQPSPSLFGPATPIAVRY